MTNESLFKDQNFISHSGNELTWKIACDVLTDEDLECLAKIIGQTFEFGTVIGIPRGGTGLAEALYKYINTKSNICLIVDDVLTTGESMERSKSERPERFYTEIIGVVVFARSPPPKWIHPIFQLTQTFSD